MNIKTKSKHFLASLLAAVLLLMPMVPAYAASVGDFSDVSSGDWFYGAVDFVVGRGLFNGSSATMFNPNGRMTRGMFITVLGRYANVNASAWLTGTVTGSGVNVRSGPGTENGIVTVLDQGASATIQGKSGDWYQVSCSVGTGYIRSDYFQPDYHHFSDVDYGQYYAGYAVWAFEKGVVNGVGSEDSFCPDSNITREQMCTMLSRFASVMGTSLGQSQSTVTFADGGDISSWASDSVSAMQRSGVVQGDAGGNFRPRGSATRAETATMLQRFETACGGFSAPNQDPPAKAPQPEYNGGSSSGGSTETPPQGELPDPSDVPDTPASLVGGTVYTKSDRIRVGLFYMTKSYDTSVSSVTLDNSSGFALGYMSDKDFYGDGNYISGSATITISDGTFTVSGAGGESYTYYDTFAISPSDDGQTRVNGNNSYRGCFEVRAASSSAIALINIVGIEDYVKGVLPFEFSAGWPTEAMKAAAVACRSFGMNYNWGTYSAYGMDILSGSNCQVYRGRGNGDRDLSLSDSIVDETSGLYLTYGGSICNTCYSSCNGGRVHSALEVFGNDVAYLQSRDDPYEQAAAGEVSGYSTWVNSSHKVGMSAWGAYAMAKYYGKSYEAILGFYYPGTNLQYGA